MPNSLLVYVLDLAVRGTLVPQDSNDEPASELLKRIAAEKGRLLKAGEIRKAKPLPAVDEPPFNLPQTWRWTRIREIASDRGQEVPQARFTYIDVTAIDKEAGVVADPKVLEASEAPSRARKTTRKGDVIYSCVRPYLLNVAVVETDFDPDPIVSTAFAILNGHGLVLPRYLWIVLRSPFMVGCVEESQRAYPRSTMRILPSCLFLSRHLGEVQSADDLGYVVGCTNREARRGMGQKGPKRRLDEIERKSIRPHIVRDRAVRAWLGEDGGRATLAARLNSGSQPSAELFVLLLETSHSLHAAFFNDKISL